MDTKFAFESSIQVRPSPYKQNEYIGANLPWGYPGLSRVAGSVLLVEAAAAAYKTVPQGFEIHCLQAQFLRPAEVGIALGHVVQDLSTTSKFACRTVAVKQNGNEAHVFTATISFLKRPLEESLPVPPFRYLPPPSADTKRAAAQEIDPALDEFSGTRRPFNLPTGTPHPAISSHSLEMTEAPKAGNRTLRAKLRITSPISDPTGQLLAIVCLSDLYVMDCPLRATDIDYGLPRIGDKTRTPTNSQVRQLASLNHSVRFARLSGFDASEGVLFEVNVKWAEGMRAVSTTAIRDIRGELIATVEQEGYYRFMSKEEMAAGHDWISGSPSQKGSSSSSSSRL